jgi:gliding motility-associated-like protein
MRISFLIHLLLLVLPLSGWGQNLSNRGKEFWLGYGFNYKFQNELPVNDQELGIYISTEQAATVVVSINGTTWTRTLNIPPNTVDASILIPKSGPNDARVLADGFSNKGIHIVSDVPVAAYAHQYGPMVSGATMLMPVETYGFSYYSINYYQDRSQSNPPEWYSWFFVIASEDNTRIRITPSDTTKAGWLPGQTYTVDLNKGEMFHVFGKGGPFGSFQPEYCSKDMTGSKIVSVPGSDGVCHPVGVFSGSGGLRLCRGDGGEFIHQQVFPSQAWGTRYLTYHTINNTATNILETNRNYYRVCVQDPTTIVKRNGTVLTGLIKNFFYEFMDSTGGDYIESDKPILVSQYTPNKNQCWNFPTSSPAPPSYGDPEMFYISPIEQGQKAVRFYVSRKSAIDYVYTNIHLPTIAVPSLRVDGAPVPAPNIIPHPNFPSYSVALARFIGPAAQHTITCDSTFTATVYGLGNYESYGYNVGTFINNLNHYGHIKNVLNADPRPDTSTCPKTPVRLFIKLGYPATSIHWKLSQVPGIFPNTDSIINNPIPIRTELINGRIYYVYTLQQEFTFSQAGSFQVPITYGATVIENCNQSNRAFIDVLVKPGPIADFNTSTPICVEKPVLFSGTPTAGIYTLAQSLWTFPDNTTATTLNATRTFSSFGNQSIRFQVIATNGCVGDTTKSIEIQPAPNSSFTTTGNICAGDSVRLTNNSTIPTGSIGQWSWNFGDGNSETRTNGQPFYHTYSLPGSYIIRMSAVSSGGCSFDTAQQTITVYDRPTASFIYDRLICSGDSILLNDQSSIAVGNIVQREWSFGDGNSTVRTNAAPFYHNYTNPGTYTIKLIVKSNQGCASDTFSQTIVVAAKPVVQFTLNGKPCIDSTWSFSSSILTGSAGSPVWHWQFGDGQSAQSSSSHQTIHAYSSSGINLIVSHWVSLGSGCKTDTVRQVVPLIEVNPIAAFSVSDTLCVNRPIRIQSTSAGISSWAWDFGNGTGSSAPPVLRTYTTSGSYTIQLVVTNSSGCRSTVFTRDLVIHPKPAVSAGPDKMIQSGTSTTLDGSILNPANYSLFWTPSQFLNNAGILNPTATPPAGSYTYQLIATDKSTFCRNSDEMALNVLDKLAIPTGFTPNGDGKNDRWRIIGLGLYPNAKMRVFDRAGQIVFEGNANTIGWDGRFRGSPMNGGVYVYMIELNDPQKQVLRGTLSLIR